jgi:molecular chaperone DnaK
MEVNNRDIREKDTRRSEDFSHKSNDNPKKNKIFAIDFGMTSSRIAYLNQKGEPEIIPNAEGETITPCFVFFKSMDNIVVGKNAKDIADIKPDRVVGFILREIGDENFLFEVDGKKFGSAEIAAFIFKKLTNDAADYLKESITDVLITCPQYF